MVGRKTKTYYYAGHTRTLQEWAEVMNLKLSTLKNRIQRGWGIEKALNEPIDLNNYQKRHKK